MRTALLPTVLLPTALLTACPGLQPLSNSVAPLITSCEGLDQEAIDWCRLAAVQQVPPMPADELVTLCPRLNNSEAEDHCWLLTVTSTIPRGTLDLCDNIKDQRYQDMCRMEAARNLAGQSARLAEVIAICDLAGSMKGECLYHIPGASRAAYSSPLHPEVLDTLTRRAISLSPDLVNWKEFAAGVGVSAANLAPGAPDPCLNFPDPAIRQHCWGRWEQ